MQKIRRDWPRLETDLASVQVSLVGKNSSALPVIFRDRVLRPGMRKMIQGRIDSRHDEKKAYNQESKGFKKSVHDGFVRNNYDRNPVKGLVGFAVRLGAPKPTSQAVRPASTASRKAQAIRAGSRAAARAVLMRTPSAPSSRAAAACDGAPRPASMITGTVACSMMISS